MKRKKRSITLITLTTTVLSLFPAQHIKSRSELPPYKNPSLPLEQRVDDLVSRMTLEEKIAQMQNAAPAVERLGIPEYDWWNEALHGVARAGIATVFPQAIGLAATFDEKLIFDVADVASTEARAKHHEFARRNERGRYKGLTFWSPNINIFRDPRWGRGQETWGEDPFLTGKLGTAYVRGLQGDDPKYLKTASTVKHFAVHSGPEPERHYFDAAASERDLRETYLPAFRQTILEGKAAGVMCAYNSVNGEPACANTRLMREILRGEWNFNGHVVSDCAAIEDIWKWHKFVKTEAEASALAVKTGTDLTCGKEYKSLSEAVKNGLIKESEIDAAVKNLMTVRFRLGMFDPPELVKYARIPFSANDSPAHRKLSLRAAQESIVLLKNSDLLPLKKNLKTVAVIGPNADDADVLLGNYNGQPSKSVTVLEGIKNKLPDAKILYTPGMYPAGVIFEPVAEEAFINLDAEYFNNRELKGEPALIRRDKQINFNWGSVSPAKEVGENNFSVRWTGKLTAPESGKYNLGWRGNGGVRIFLDGELIVDDLKNPWTRNVLKEIEFEAGRTYDIRVEYLENANLYASSKLVWSSPSAEAKLRADALEKARQADTVIMVMGISPMIEGEEMDVKLEGFRGGDRTDIQLPEPQRDLIKAVHALGKPVVLVLMGGSALAVNWESENIPAILKAWYPGQEGGTAIADVLFGDYNPAGRLPVTFYRSVNDRPPFEDYKMAGRTYRYFTGETLYPFGYGLSYTKFAYSNLRFKDKIKTGETLKISVDVRNTGKFEGDEVVQLYVSNQKASVPVPIRSLEGFRRIRLKPNERKTVSFELTPRQLSVVLENGKRIAESGEFLISAGGEQPGFTGRTDAATTMTISGNLIVSGQKIEITD